MAADATTATADDTAMTSPRQGRGSNLTPFQKGDVRAAAAGRKGGEVRRANRDARRKTVRETAHILTEIGATFDRERLGTHAAAVAGWLMAEIVNGRIPVRNGDEAATLLRALVDVARIEEGQATSTSVVAHVGLSARAEVLALRDQARQALGAAVDVSSADASAVPRPGVSCAATADHDTPSSDTPNAQP